MKISLLTLLDVQNRITKPRQVKILDMRKDVRYYPRPVAIGIFNTWANSNIDSGNRHEIRCRDVVLRTNMGITGQHRWHTWDWVVVMRDAIIATSLIGDIRAEGIVSKTGSAERVLATY